MKKLLSVLLVVLMLVGMLPMNAIHTHAAEKSETMTIAANKGTVSGTSISWSSGNLAFTANKNTSSNAIRTTDTDHFRLYVGFSATLTCSAGNITKIVMTATGSSYAIAPTGSDGSVGTVSGTTITIVPTASSNTYTIPTISKQTRIKSITVTYAEATAACEHTNTTETTENATCTAAGSTKVVCDDCGETVSETEIPALGHNYVDGVCQNCQNKLATVSFSVPSQVAAVDSITAGESGVVTLPEADDYTGKYPYTFVGWTTQSVSDTETMPTIYTADSEYTPAADITLYAVYTYTVAGSGGSTEYVLTDASGINPGDTVVIATTKDNSTYYAMSNGNGTSKAPTATLVTVSGSKLESAPEDTLKWDIGGSKDAYIFYVSGGTSSWLYCTSTNNGVRVGTNTANTFKIDASSGYLYHNGTGRYIGIYNDADWRCYTSVNTNITGQTLCFFVKSSGGSATYYTSTLEALDAECQHTNTTEATVDATCTDAGKTTVTCDDCGTIITETEIPATGHTEVIDAAKAPTCVATGLTEGSHCSVCNAVIVAQQTVPATGEHTYVDGTCSVCGAEKPSSGSVAYQLVTDSEEIIAGGQFVIVATDSNGNHFALPTTIATKMNGVAVTITDNKVVFVEGTTPVWTVESCDSGIALYNGSSYLKYASSTNLGSSTTAYKFSLTAVGAVGDAFKVASTATTARGLVFRAGTNYDLFGGYAISNVTGTSEEYFGVKFYKMVTLCDHENTENRDAVAATCTSVGYTAGKQCTECGVYTEGHEEIPALGHSYDDGVVTTAPGCTTTGVKNFTCSACGNTYTETVAATGHLNTTETTVDATCTVAGSTTVTCDDCGAVISSTTIPAGHSWDEGKVTTEATCEEPGVTTYTCSVCKETKTEEIVALGHNWDEGEVTTAATCDTDGVKTYTCTRDESHTKTESIPATGHSYVSGICSVCKKEISRFQLVTDYTQILAGGEYIVAAKVGDSFYAINSASGTDWLKAQSVDVTGSGADMMVVYADGLPIWNVEYFLGRNNCFSLYSPAASQYLKGTESTSLGADTEPWAWTFIDGSNSNGEESDGTFAVTQDDGSVAFVAASAAVIDRAISLKSTTNFTNYSVRTAGYNRELYFFKLVEANETEYTVKFVENGITTITQTVPVDENVLKMPQPTGAAMPEGYTKFVGWVELPHTESLVAPTTIYSAEEIDGANNTVAITEDKTFYALYSREDPDAEGQALSYHLVTNNNQLVIGQKYIIVGIKDGQYYAMSRDQLSGDRGAAAVTPDADGVITFLPEDNVAAFDLNQGYEIGSFAFLDLNMNQFLYCASTGTENTLKSQATLDKAASFLITINADGSYSVIASQTSTTTRTNIMFNTDSDSGIFSCYDPAKTGIDQTQTFLYVGVPNSVYATYYTTGLCNHTWNLTNHVEATCENAGYSLYTCSLCGEIKMEDVQAHGHNVDSYVTTSDPTCTTTGTATATCTNCGAEFTDVIPALGHTEVVDAAVAATCTETGLTEGKHCSVCDVVLVAQQVAPALGHDFDATKGVVDEETEDYPVVIYPCSRCEEKHIAAQLKFTNASLTLQNNIVVNFKAPANVMGEGEYAGFSDLRAEFTYGNRVGENMIKATSAEIVQQADGKYSVPCRRVTPSQIGDEITATLYGTYDGVEYSYKMKYSAAEYCYTMLGTTTDTELKTLLVNLLYYCDAAREYTTYQGVDVDYKYYGSVTEELTEEQKAYRTVSDGFQSVKGLSGEGEFAATWKSASLILGEATSIRFRVNLGGYDIDAVTVKAKVGGKDYTDISVKQDGETYLIQIDGISAHRMRETVEVTLYYGETVISKTARYSIESYAAEMTGTDDNLENMLIAMMSYGDAAAAYNP